MATRRSSMSIPTKKVLCIAVVCMAVVMSSGEAAVTCGGVVKSLGPCMSYLRAGSGRVPPPPGTCCAGVRSLKAMAPTPADRKTACQCMKTAAAKMKDLNYGNAANLPSLCGVSISYIFSRNINCNIVQ